MEFHLEKVDKCLNVLLFKLIVGEICRAIENELETEKNGAAAHDSYC